MSKVKLEGIRESVFLDRYSLKDEKGKPTEKTPEQMWRRVSKAIASVEKPSKRQFWEDRFYEAMEDFKFVPGGRVLAGAGTGYQVTFYNCLPPDQEILTPQGYQAIKDIKVGDMVISGKKRERKVTHVFTRQTEESLYVIKPMKLGFDEVRLTGKHPVLAIKSEWVNTHRSRDGLRLKSEPDWIKAVDLKKGDYVAVAWNQQIRSLSKINLINDLPQKFALDGEFVTKSKLKKPIKAEIEIDERLMLLMGTWLGDGCVTHRTGTDIPAGIQITFNKQQVDWANEIASILQEKFLVVPTVREDRWGQQLIQVRVESYPIGIFFKQFFGAYSHKKKIPQTLMEQPNELLFPLMKGMFRADGYLTDNQLGIALSNKTLAVQLHQLMLRTGRFLSIFENTHKNGRHKTFRITGGISQTEGLCEYIFDQKRENTHHDQDYYLSYNDLFWVRIESINTVPYKGTVYDLEVEEDHSFITGGIVVSNCFVIPSPQDSRDGILDNLKRMIEIMARGGGVGVNISSLRPKGARVKKVNGFSSGPCNWAEMYSLATHDIIQQGGCFSPDARIMTHQGLIKIEDIVSSKKTYFAATHKGYKRITAKFNNGKKEVYQVETKGGYKVKTTAQHKFLTFDENGSFYLKELKDFREGDQVVLLPSSFRDDIPEVFLNTTIPAPSKYSYGRRTAILPKTLTKELAFILGVYLSDGSRIKDEYSFAKGFRFAVHGKRQKDLLFFQETLKDAFGLEPILKKGDGDVINVHIFSRAIALYFEINNFLKENSSKVFVPEQIFSSPRQVVEAFIAGVFFGDGSNRGRKGGFRICSVNKKFLEDISLLLLNLGIASKLKVQKRIEWQDLYTLTINGNRYMEKFFRMVLAYSEKAYDHAFSQRDGFYNFPVNLVKRFGYLSGIQRTIAYTNPTTSNKTMMFLEHQMPKMQEKDLTDGEFLTSTITDKIKKITRVGESQVYDLEVEDVHLLSGNGFYTSNSRRGALMLMLWDWHPDIEEFITVKQDLSRINGANLSVCVSDAFMEAVKKDEDWDLIFPDLDDPEYDQKWDGIMAHWKALGKKTIVYKTIRARHLWDLICQAAWRSAEPGLVFMERYNKWYNNWYWNTINCVNPCVTEDTLVSTTKGIKTIGALYKEGLPFQVVVNGKAYLSSQVKFTGTKQVYRLKTVEGYVLRLTKDHKVYTENGKKEAGELQPGEKILLSTGGSFGTAGTIEEGQVLGWLVGDGSMKEDVATLYFYRKEKEELAPQFAQMVNGMVSKEGLTLRSYPVAAQYVPSEDKAIVESVRLWRIANRYGITHKNKYVVPEGVFKGSEELQRGFLQGLFSSDGSVQATLQKGVSVRLTSVSRDLLIQTQRLLLNFGIVSKLYLNRRPQMSRLLPDGKGGKKEYECKAYHELIISKKSLIQFAALIGFLQEEKQKKLQSLLSLYNRGPYTQSFTATFLDLEKEGIEDVYDITVADIHRFSANGLIISNCGEEGLPNFGVCNLASLNLSAFVKGYEVGKAGEFDYESLAEHARIAVRFQDNVVDADQYIYPEIEQMQHQGERRIGLGTLGLGDALIKMHLRYGSDEALPVVDKIYKTIRDAAYDESINIAKEKGAFPRINIKKHLQGYFIKQLPESIRKKLAKHGIRNSMLLQAAPTGTTSLLSGTSSGIEPVYEFEFLRRSRLGEHKLYHHLYGEWKKIHSDGERPAYFVSANDLTPEDHVKVQSIIQKYIDASISKTVNAPKTHTVEDVQKLYMLAYDMGCKGITYMRDGSRQGVLERIEEKKEEPKVQSQLQVPITPRVPRPLVLSGTTYKTDSPIGKMYITINQDEKGEPFEVFINNGKSGSDVMAMADALGRMISFVLRIHSQVPPRERMREIVSELTGIGGARSVGFGENRVRSLPDAVAKVLAKHYNFRVNGKVEDKVALEEIQKALDVQGVDTTASDGNGNNGGVQKDVVAKDKSVQQLTLAGTSETQSEMSASTSTTSLFDICPECGTGSLAYEEGCKKCYSCGYSEC